MDYCPYQERDSLETDIRLWEKAVCDCDLQWDRANESNDLEQMNRWARAGLRAMARLSKAESRLGAVLDSWPDPPYWWYE